jgi:low affinity Fe/Cu permease
MLKRPTALAHDTAATSGHVPTNGHKGLLGWMHRALEWFSGRATAWAGSSWAFATALALVLGWAASGPLFGFSQTWQLFINTGTTIATFLMVFLIQRAQNKESLAVQIKLNELLASQQGASNRLINAEDFSEDEIQSLHAKFAKLASDLEQKADETEPHSVREEDEAATPSRPR